MLLGLIEFWVGKRTFRFLQYKGPSRMRANKTLTHLAFEHYLPEGQRWLDGLRLVMVLWTLSFFPACWALISQRFAPA